MQSSHRLFLLGVLVGCAATAGAGMLLFGSTGTEDAKRSRVLAGLPGRAEAAESEDSPAYQAFADESGLRSAAAPAPTTKVETVVESARVDDLVAEYADISIERASGEGSIWGRVDDEDGAGLAGVVVRASGDLDRSPDAESPEDVGRAAPPVHDVEATVREAVEMYEASRESLYETQTDAGGSYRFDGLPEGEWGIQAFRRDWVITPIRRGGSRVALGSQVDFEARPVSTVNVEVFFLDGSQPEFAAIQCESSTSRDGTFAWSPAEPTLRLTPGRYEIVAMSGALHSNRSDGYELKSESQSVEIEAGTAAPALRFHLEGRSGIRGRLVLPNDGISGDNPRDFAMPLGRDPQPDLAALASAERSDWSRGTQEFVFLDLAAGRWVIGASRSSQGNICVHHIVDVADTIVRQDLEIPPIDLATYLVADVAGGDGRPLENVDFSMRHQDGNRSSSWGVSEMRTTDGRYLIPIREDIREAYFSAKGKDDTFGLEVEHEVHGSKNVELVAGQTQIQVSFAAPARLEVTVTGYAGSALEGRLFIDLARESEQGSYSRGRGGDRLSPEGVQVFDAVQPGPYVLSMRVSEAGNSRPSYQPIVHSEPIRLVAGPNTARVSVPVLYELVVSYPDGEAGATMQIASSADHFTEEVRLDDDGRAVFADQPAGHYILRCWEPYGQMEIDVPCGTVVFQPQVVNAMRVSITSASGTLAAARFLDGDLVVAVDGMEIESQEDTFLLWRRRKDFDITVLRSGQRVDLHVADFDMRDAANLGGNLTPTSR